jgi:hypothetical protein
MQKDPYFVRNYQKTSMRKISYFLTFLICNCCYGQKVAEMNKKFNISDSLQFRNEIRIYKSYSTTNGSELFRMFRAGDKWQTEYYKYYAATSPGTSSRYEKIDLVYPDSLNISWLYFLDTNVEYLPGMDKIKYKLKGKMEYELYEGKYEARYKRIAVLDGTSYKVFVRNDNKQNQIEFDNPDSYLEHYPDVDEINAYASLLAIVKNKFGIWK